MSESTRRRKYRYDRVVIETARILSSQFDDAVVYLTGAQVELLRNVTEYLRRIETYASEYHLGYYLVPTVADYDDLMAIVADLEDTLMGNPNTIWGYKDRLLEQRTAQSSGAGYTDCFTVPVPAGYVHVVEYWTLQHQGGVNCGVALLVSAGAVYPLLYYAPNQPTSEYAYGSVNLTLKEDDAVQLRVYGLPDTTWCSLCIWGHTMVVP